MDDKSLSPKVITAFIVSGLVILAAVFLPLYFFNKGHNETEPEFVFSYADNQAEDYPTTRGGVYFARLVNERTNGRILIKVYDSGQLGEEESVTSQVEYGGIDFARISLSNITSYSEEANVLMMPYIYRDSGHMWRVLDGDIGDEVIDSFDGSGIIPLSWYDAGVRNFYTTKEIRGVDDMKGLIIRVLYSDLMADMVRALGAIPVEIGYPQVYSVLEQGQVDGAENNIPSYYSMSHYEVAKYYIEDEHVRIPELQIMSETTREKLSDEDFEIISQCARESSEYERSLWKDYEIEARQEAVKKGCRIISLSEDEKAEFRRRVEPLYRKYCADHMDMIEEIIELGKEK